MHEGFLFIYRNSGNFQGYIHNHVVCSTCMSCGFLCMPIWSEYIYVAELALLAASQAYKEKVASELSLRTFQQGNLVSHANVQKENQSFPFTQTSTQTKSYIELRI